MKESKPEAIRNVAVLSYGGAGKTTLIEAFLCASGGVPQMGCAAAGTRAMDYEPEEHHRKISIQTSLCQIPWNDAALNLLDNPGAPSFQAEAKQATHVVDAVLWVFNASAGVKTELEKLWEYAAERSLPGLIFISGLDREGTSWAPLVEELEKALEIKTVPLSLPIGQQASLEGTVEALNALVALLPSPVERAAAHPVQASKLGGSGSIQLSPDPTAAFAAYVFKTIIDPFMGRLNYLRVYAGALAPDAGFLNATRNVREKGGRLFHGVGKKYTPIEKAVAGDIVAIAKLKDTQTGDTLTSDNAPLLIPKPPLPRPLLSFALEPKSKADVEKVSLGLHKLVEEDPSLEFVRNTETHEMILSAMGQLHGDVAFEKLKRKYGIEVNVHTPKVPYKETIRKAASAQGKYKKQTGGHGQYGDTWLKLEPLKRGAGFQFVDEIVGGAIPRNFIPAVEKGVVEAMHEGILGGFPVVDLRVTLYDGSYHDVDSSEMAFKIAASMGLKKAMEQASPVLLEPIMTVEVSTPDEFMGAVIGDLNSRRGRIQDTVPKAHGTIIKAAVPLAEMMKYSSTLNSLTGGRATYSMDFLTYEEVPREQAARILEEQKAAKAGAVP